MLTTILIVLALGCFLLAAFTDRDTPVRLVPLGLALLTATLLIPLL